MEFETPAEDRAKFTDREHQTGRAGPAQAGIFTGLGDLLEPVDELQFEDDGKLTRKAEDAACKLKLGTTGTVVQTKMSNADKTVRQDMRKKAADELQWREGHDLLFAIVTVVEIFEGDGILINGENAVIGDGNAEDVAAEILHELLDTVERSLNKDFPISGHGLMGHGGHIESVITCVEKAILPEPGKSGAEVVAELIGKQLDRKEELALSGLPAIACG